MTKRPTVEEYKQIGAELKELREKLIETSVLLGNKCGKKYSHVLTRSILPIESIRNELEEKMFVHHPELEGDTDSLRIFYGRNRDMEVNKKCN